MLHVTVITQFILSVTLCWNVNCGFSSLSMIYRQLLLYPLMLLPESSFSRRFMQRTLQQTLVSDNFHISENWIRNLKKILVKHLMAS